MNKIKHKLNPEIIAEEPIDIPNGLELVITPKKEFLEWFKNIKGILGEMDVKKQIGCELLSCPNCKSRMDNYELNNDPGELWHICPKCNLSFSNRQYKYFTIMIMRLLSGKFKHSNNPE